VAGAPTPATPARPTLNWVFLGAVAVAVALFAATIPSRAIDTHQYPEAADRFLARSGLLAPPHRIAEQDIVGDFLALVHGRRSARFGGVFVDDRYDMYPLRVSADYAELLKGRPGSTRILDRYRVDVVLWDEDLPLVTILKASGDWRQRYRKAGWVVLQRIS
jgi:hypothetical protein